MFPSLPHTLRAHGLQADVRTLLQLRRALERGLVQTVGELYLVLKSMVCTHEKEFGPFTAGFYEYFLAIKVNEGERLESAVMRSRNFQEWKKQRLEDDYPEGEKPNLHGLIDEYLDAVHQSRLDIQNILSGKDILKKDNPDMADGDPQSDDAPPPRPLEEMADYSDISLDELLKRMERVAQQQRGKHFGGSHWIGQGGISPYGNGGAAAGGIRVGGTGGGRMARRVMNDRRYFPADGDAILQDDNMDAALAALKGIQDSSAEIILDVPTTVEEGSKQGGLYLPYTKEKEHQKVQVVLLIDNGGYSMNPYVRAVQKLFAKMKTRFAHDLKTYYFHNTAYGGFYSDSFRSKFVPIERLTDLDKNYSIFIIGDADMAPYELDRSSLNTWLALKEAFPRIAWLNPNNEKWWNGSMTTATLSQIFEMYPMSPNGIERAVRELNGKRKGGLGL